MTSALIRPFRRADRDQLTQLVQAHAEAVVPGMLASASAILAALDRRPGEFIEDLWVSERLTLVAELQHRVVAAAHLLRYFGDDRAGPAYRGAGTIEWLVFWPHAPAGNPAWPDAASAARALMAGCLGQLQRWEVSRQDAGGELPVPGVYGVPEQWPHVAALYEQAGFAHTGHTEIVYLARTRDLARPAPPLPGMSVRRSVGMSGCRLSAVRGAEVLGYVEVETFDQGERLSRHGGWADIGNLCVAAPSRRRGIGTWLLGEAADWLELAGVDRVLDYAWLDGTDPGGVDYAACRAFLPARGFRELTRARRGWTRTP